MKHALFNRRAFMSASAGVAGAFLAAGHCAEPASAAALGRVTIAVGGQGSLYHLPLAIAQALGYFQAEGLQVVVRDLPAGALAVQAVQDGAADLCCAAFEHTLRLQARGLQHRAIVVLGRAPQMALGVSPRALPSYKDLASLAGRRIGVSSLGSSTHLAAALMLARGGVVAGASSFVAVGSGGAALTALRSGQVHALCHTDPVMTLLEHKHDTRIVADLRSLKASHDLFGGSMPASCLMAPQPFVQKQPAQAQALVNGVVHALKWLQTAAAADLIKALPSEYLMGDRGLYLAAFSRVRETYSVNGAMPDDGPTTALRALMRVHPELAEFKPDLARTFISEFIRKARQKFTV